MKNYKPKEELKDFLSKLLEQVVRLSDCGPLSLIDTDPLELGEAQFLVISADPHRAYVVFYDDTKWVGDGYEDSKDFVELLNKLTQKPKYNTEIWAVKYLTKLGYEITKNNKIIQFQKQEKQDFLDS